MDDKKFLLLLSVFGAISLLLVLSLGAVVVLDTKGHADPSKKNSGGAAASSPGAPSLLDRK